jgi:hypothetical protein
MQCVLPPPSRRIFCSSEGRGCARTGSTAPRYPASAPCLGQRASRWYASMLSFAGPSQLKSVCAQSNDGQASSDLIIFGSVHDFHLPQHLWERLVPHQLATRRPPQVDALRWRYSCPEVIAEAVGQPTCYVSAGSCQPFVEFHGDDRLPDLGQLMEPTGAISGSFVAYLQD